jgi:hypothetical protein
MTSRSPHDLVPGTAAFELLAWSADDFTGLWVAFEFARTYAGITTFNEQREYVLTMISALLTDGLLRVGEMSPSVNGLSYWSGGIPSQEQRLSQYLASITSPPTPEINIWLHATEEGKLVVNNALN